MASSKGCRSPSWDQEASIKIVERSSKNYRSSAAIGLTVIGVVLVVFSFVSFPPTPSQQLTQFPTVRRVLGELSDLPDLTDKEKEVIEACSKSGSPAKVIDTLKMIREKQSQFDSVYDSVIKACNDAFPVTSDGAAKVSSSSKSWMKGLPRGELFYTSSGENKISRTKIDEVSNRVFYEQRVRKNMENPEDILVDQSSGKIMFSESGAGTIKKVDYDGTGVVQMLVEREKPGIMTADFDARMLYFTTDPEGVIKKVSMDPADNRHGSVSEIVVVADSEVKGLFIDSGFLYYTEYAKGTLIRRSIIDGSSEVIVSDLVSPRSVAAVGNQVFVLNNDGHEITVANVDSKSSRVILTGLNAPGRSLRRDSENNLIWSDSNGGLYLVQSSTLMSAASTLQFDAASTETFVTMSTSLATPTGFDVYLWPKSDGLAFKALNKYTRQGVAPYVEVFEDMPWVLGKLVEPARETDLVVVDPVSSNRYEWTITGDSGEELTFEGSTVPQFKLYSTGKHPLTLTEYDSAGAQLRQIKSYAEVKYVRREIRTLYEDDRNDFLDIIKAHIDTPTRQGKMIYGPLYFDMMYFTAYRNMLSGDRMCDHMNDGLGFMPQHMGLTLLFEQSIHMINPELSVPYWDFTIDGHEVFVNKGGDFDALWDMQVFASDWFGDGGSNDHHTFTEGRWAFTKVEDNCWTCVHNSYGFLRAPWNVNNSPYIQRWRTYGGASSWNLLDVWPQCEFHHSMLTSYESWEEFGVQIEKEPFNAVRSVLGGTFHGEDDYAALDDFLNVEDANKLRAHAMSTRKKLSRAGLLACPDFCSPETPLDECTCSCGPRDELDARLNDPEELDIFFDHAFGDENLTTPLDDSMKKQMVSLVCNAGIAGGDDADTGSNDDAIFWVMHPTLERLLFWRQLNKPFLDNTWTTENSYKGTFYKDLSTACCGHGPNDVMSWFIRLDDPDKGWGAFYTVGQYYDNSNTAQVGYVVPYVYDNYEWPHCDEEGYDLKAI